MILKILGFLTPAKRIFMPHLRNISSEERGLSFLELVFTIAILAIVLAIALPNIVQMFNESKTANLSRKAYAIMQDWSKEAVLQGGATLTNQGTALVVSGNRGYQKIFGLPSWVSVYMDWVPFPKNFSRPSPPCIFWGLH
jgi:prepilin-type N-terminal cleavage/methylation domain-containing protein